MLSYLAELEEYFGPFRLFRFITFRAAFGGFTALLIGFILAPPLFSRLRRWKMEQALRERKEVGDLATLHAAKKNTPTMGGLAIYFSLTGSAILWARPNVYVISALVIYSGLTFIGFVDDALKISRKNSRGFPGRYKLISQAFLAFITLLILFSSEISGPRLGELWIPFYKNVVTTSMPVWVVFLLFFLFMAGFSNAINLTDGVDGLAIGCTVSSALAFMIMAYLAGNAIMAEYLFISYLPGTEELVIVCSALLGASLVFLWYNAHPAEVFMGDTGSLALGGLIGTVAFLIHQPFTLLIVGGIYVLEAGSVMIQVFSYKTTGRRVFRMSPLHHHFELKGWHENKVVIRFWILSLLFAIIGLSTLKLR